MITPSFSPTATERVLPKLASGATTVYVFPDEATYKTFVPDPEPEVLE